MIQDKMQSFEQRQQEVRNRLVRTTIQYLPIDEEISLALLACQAQDFPAIHQYVEKPRTERNKP